MPNRPIGIRFARPSNNADMALAGDRFRRTVRADTLKRYRRETGFGSKYMGQSVSFPINPLGGGSRNYCLSTLNLYDFSTLAKSHGATWYI